MMQSLVITLSLALLPILAAGLCIVLMRRSVPALFLAVCLLVLGIGFGPPSSLGSGTILAAFLAQVSPSLLTILLLSAGVTLINGGPSRGFAQRLVQRIPHPDARLIAALVLGTLTGFGSSSTAVQFLADILGQTRGKISSAHEARGVAAVTGACTFGSLLVPVSVWWTFFAGQRAPDLAVGPHGWTVRLPVIFCAATAYFLVRESRGERIRRIAAGDVRPLLRLTSPPLKRDFVPWALFFAIVIAYPLILPLLVRGDDAWTLPTAVLLGTVAASGWWLWRDVRTSVQALWPLPSLSQAASEGARAAYLSLRQTTSLVYPATASPGRDDFRLLAGDSADQATHLVFSSPRPRRGMDLGRERHTVGRLRLALERQWALWERGLSGGLGASLVFVTAIVFKNYYLAYLRGFGLALDFSPSLPSGSSAAWLGDFAGCLILICVLGGVGGYFIGTAFGTFALVFALILPALQSLASAPPIPWGPGLSLNPRSYEEMLVGLLICVAAAVNSCSPQADNVNVASKALQIDTETLDQTVRPTLLKALGVTVAAGLILPALVN